MRQFEVYPNPDRESAVFAPFLVVLSSHHLSNLDAAIVAPLICDKQLTTSEIELEIEFDGRNFILAMSELFATDRRRLRKVRGSVTEHEDAIRRALDRLFNGF